MSSAKASKDRDFVNRILSVDGEMAWRQFVEDYTDQVLYRVWMLMKSHCNYPASGYICCLLLLQKQRKEGYGRFDARTQCDECMDSYIWVFEYLKNKLKSYKAINDCSLKTYIWSIINSHALYIDWLRWKYGRAY